MLSGLFKKNPAEKAPSTGLTRHPIIPTENVKYEDLVQAPASARDKPTMHKPEIPYKGDPENRVLVWDLDETLVLADVYKRDLRKPKVRKEIEAQGYTIKQTKHGRYYVLRPGAEEILKSRYEAGHVNVLTSRDLTPYMKDIFESEPALNKYCAGYLSRDNLISKPNQDYKKYPQHPDNLSFWGRTKNFMHGLFVRCPKYCWKKFCSIFSGRPVWFEEGRGVAGKYPPNIVDLLVDAGHDELKALPKSHILIDNYAEMNSDDANAEKNYHGRAYQDSLHSGDFAVISPNVSYKEGEKPHCFMAQAPEPKAADGEYQWVKNVNKALDRGWKEQFKMTTGREPKANAL